ncbi:MAG: sulfotransferase [Pseudomonadota bacterium]
MSGENPSLDLRLRDAQQLVSSGDFTRAREVIDEVLESSPDQQEALYMRVVCARFLADTELAHRTLKQLITNVPDYGRAFQEEGHLYFQSGKMKEALQSYRRACHFNPTLEASWRRQAEIFASSGNVVEAKKAQTEVRRLKSLARELLAAMNHLHEGRILKAERLARAFLQKNPKNPDGIRLLADIAARLNILDEAEFLLESACIFDPENTNAKLDYIQILRKRQKYRSALKQAQDLFDQNSRNPVFMSTLAIENMHNNRFDEAFALFDQVLEKVPGDPATLVSKGHALKTYGHHDDAVQSYRSAYASMPDHGDAWFGLANLKTYRFTDDEIAIMEREVASERLGYQARIQICFSLGKAFEDRGCYVESFGYYQRGNEMKRVQSRYDADQMSAELQAQIDICKGDLFDRHRGAGHSAPDPIFIVGLPRAGSTLLEQILASHSQVDGTQELPNILALAHRLRERRRVSEKSAYPENLYTLDSAQFGSFGEKFLEDTRTLRGSAPFFIDKMPNNFRHIALIHLMLPNAKIIDARREPMSCCFSGFKQLFAEGQEFTYGLNEIGQYYRDYVRLMHHWDNVLPGKILRIHHDDVLNDLEGEVRRMLGFCNLPFEAQCLEFHKTERSVRTASSEQVRQPINRRGVDQWRPFEANLDPLKHALGPIQTNWR